MSEIDRVAQMAKIKAVLDQETWVAVDVPDEFQTIVASLSSLDSTLNSDGLVSKDPGLEMAESRVSDELQNLDSGESVENTASPLLTGSNKESKIEPAPIRNDNSTTNEHGRSTSQTLVYGGVGYHMVNWGCRLKLTQGELMMLRSLNLNNYCVW